MTLRSQGDNGLVDTNVDISAVERSLRRARNQAAPTEPIRAEMEQGQGSGKGNTAHLSPNHQPDVTAKDVDDFEKPFPRYLVPPPRTNAYRRRHVEVDDDYDEEDEELIGSWNEQGVRTVETVAPIPWDDAYRRFSIEVSHRHDGGDEEMHDIHDIRKILEELRTPKTLREEVHFFDEDVERDGDDSEADYMYDYQGHQTIRPLSNTRRGNHALMNETVNEQNLTTPNVQVERLTVAEHNSSG